MAGGFVWKFGTVLSGGEGVEGFFGVGFLGCGLPCGGAKPRSELGRAMEWSELLFGGFVEGMALPFWNWRLGFWEVTGFLG